MAITFVLNMIDTQKQDFRRSKTNLLMYVQ